MQRMNAAVQVDKNGEGEVAADFLRTDLNTESDEHDTALVGRVLITTYEHLRLVIPSLCAAIIVTEWMVHPVQAYVYVLEGTLIVEFADGSARSSRPDKDSPKPGHTGIVAGTTARGVVRFLAVFFGGKDVPNVLHPPKQ